MLTAADLSTGTALEETNRFLLGLSADARVAWAIEHTPGLHVVTSSFGVQAAITARIRAALKGFIVIALFEVLAGRNAKQLEQPSGRTEAGKAGLKQVQADEHG